MQISKASGHAVTEQQGGIVALLPRLERQIAEDHLMTPQDDNADDTIQAIVALLPNAPAAEIKMVLDMPKHLEQLAHEAEAVGHRDEAWRFTVLGEALSGTPQTKPAVASQPVAVIAPPLNAGDNRLQLNQSVCLEMQRNPCRCPTGGSLRGRLHRGRVATVCSRR